MKVTSRTGNVIGVRHVQSGEDLLLVTSGGMLIRTRTGEVRRTGRSTQGVKLIDLEKDDKVVAVAGLAEREEEGVGEAEQETLDLTLS